MHIQEQKAQLVSTFITKFRLSQGWNVLEGRDQMLAVAAWLEVLDAARIPLNAYEQLSFAEKEYRVDKITEGKGSPHFTPELFVMLYPKVAAKLAENARIEKSHRLKSAEMSEDEQTKQEKYNFFARANRDGVLIDGKTRRAIFPDEIVSCSEGFLIVQHVLAEKYGWIIPSIENSSPESVVIEFSKKFNMKKAG